MGRGCGRIPSLEGCLKINQYLELIVDHFDPQLPHTLERMAQFYDSVQLPGYKRLLDFLHPFKNEISKILDSTPVQENAKPLWFFLSKLQVIKKITSSLATFSHALPSTEASLRSDLAALGEDDEEARKIITAKLASLTLQYRTRREDAIIQLSRLFVDRFIIWPFDDLVLFIKALNDIPIDGLMPIGPPSGSHLYTLMNYRLNHNLPLSKELFQDFFLISSKY